MFFNNIIFYLKCNERILRVSWHIIHHGQKYEFSDAAGLASHMIHDERGAFVLDGRARFTSVVIVIEVMIPVAVYGECGSDAGGTQCIGCVSLIFVLQRDEHSVADVAADHVEQDRGCDEHVGAKLEVDGNR